MANYINESISSMFDGDFWNNHNSSPDANYLKKIFGSKIDADHDGKLTQSDLQKINDSYLNSHGKRVWSEDNSLIKKMAKNYNLKWDNAHHKFEFKDQSSIDTNSAATGGGTGGVSSASGAGNTGGAGNTPPTGVDLTQKSQIKIPTSYDDIITGKPLIGNSPLGNNTSISKIVDEYKNDLSAQSLGPGHNINTTPEVNKQNIYNDFLTNNTGGETYVQSGFRVGDKTFSARYADYNISTEPLTKTIDGKTYTWNDNLHKWTYGDGDNVSTADATNIHGRINNPAELQAVKQYILNHASNMSPKQYNMFIEGLRNRGIELGALDKAEAFNDVPNDTNPNKITYDELKDRIDQIKLKTGEELFGPSQNGEPINLEKTIKIEKDGKMVPITIKDLIMNRNDLLTTEHFTPQQLQYLHDNIQQYRFAYDADGSGSGNAYKVDNDLNWETYKKVYGDQQELKTFTSGENNAPNEIKVNGITINKNVIDPDQLAYEYDPKSNQYKLNFKDDSGTGTAEGHFHQLQPNESFKKIYTSAQKNYNFINNPTDANAVYGDSPDTLYKSSDGYHLHYQDLDRDTSGNQGVDLDLKGELKYNPKTGYIEYTPQNGGTTQYFKDKNELMEHFKKDAEFKREYATSLNKTALDDSGILKWDPSTHKPYVIGDDGIHGGFRYYLDTKEKYNKFLDNYGKMMSNIDNGINFGQPATSTNSNISTLNPVFNVNTGNDTVTINNGPTAPSIDVNYKNAATKYLENYYKNPYDPFKGMTPDEIKALGYYSQGNNNWAPIENSDYHKNMEKYLGIRKKAMLDAYKAVPNHN